MGCLSMKKIIHVLKSSPGATGKIVILLAIYTAQSIFRVAQSEVLNRSTEAIEYRDAWILKEVMVFACIVLAGNLIIDVLEKLCLQKFINDTTLHVQQDLLTRMMKFKRKHFLKEDASSYLTGIAEFAESMVDSSVWCFFDTCASIVSLVVCTVYMGYLSLPLTGFVLIYNVIIRFGLRKLEKQVKKNVQECNRVVKKNNGFLVEILENMLTIRGYQKEPYFQNELKVHETNTYKSRIRSFIWNSGMKELIWCTLKFAEFILIYGVGGILLYHGTIDFGVFLAYPVVMDYFVKAINQLFSALVDKNKALADMENLEFLYEESDMEDEEDHVPFFSQEIRFEHVSFGFDLKNGERREILKDVSFVIKPGEKVLLAGANGQGKSTLLYLISGQLRPDSGEIFYGDVPLGGKNLYAICNNYVLITQEHNMLPCSVLENIKLSEEEEGEKCKELLEQFHMEYAAERKAALLSEGEKQRVNIARAFFRRQKRAVFLLGDEIFSNIDPENADHIQKMIESTFANDTVIMVCHGETGFLWNKRILVENGTIQMETR